MLIVALITLAFAVSRFFVPVTGKIEKKNLYKTFAHVFVGGLFGAALYAQTDWELWALGLGLTAVELVAFFTRRPKKPADEEGYDGV